MSSVLFGDLSVADVRDDESDLKLIRDVTGLAVSTVTRRIAEAHGRTRVRKVFAIEWPSNTDALGELTASVALNADLHHEIMRALDVSSHLVTRRLNEVAGNTLVRNVFRDKWPEDDPDDNDSDDDESAADVDANGAGGSSKGAMTATANGRAVAAPSAPTIIERDDGIEEEDTSGDTITKPFDPNLIRVKLWTPTVDLVMKRLQAGEIDLAPDFQRAAGIWKDKPKSQLIESLLIRIPLPAFYFDASDEDRLIVVDGIQRITALKRFLLDKDLELTGLEYLTELEGKTVEGLPRPLVRRIEETMLTVNLIERGTPERAKLNIFKRLNTGGEPLKAQEIRHAMNPGPAREYLKQLSESHNFIEATQGKFSDDRMTARECVLRFCAFALTPPANYPTDGDLDSFLHGAMRRLNEVDESSREDLANQLERAMSASYEIFGDRAFRKPKRQGSRSPVNKALFEAWAIGFNGCSDDELHRLIGKKSLVEERFAETLEANREFEKALSQGTGDPKKVRLRFATIADLLRELAK